MVLDSVTEDVVRRLEGRPVVKINELVTLAGCTGLYAARVVQMYDTPVGRRVLVAILGGQMAHQDVAGVVTCYFPNTVLEVPESWIRRVP